MSQSRYFFCFAILPLVILATFVTSAPKPATWNESIAVGSFNKLDSGNGPYSHFVELNYSVKSAKVSDWPEKKYKASDSKIFLSPDKFKPVKEVTLTVKSVNNSAVNNWLNNSDNVALPNKIVAKDGVFQAIIGLEEIPNTLPKKYQFREIELCDDENEECVKIKISREDIGKVLEKNIYLHLTKLPENAMNVGSLVPGRELATIRGKSESVTIEIFGNVWVNNDSARRLGYVRPEDDLMLKPLYGSYSPFKEHYGYKLKAYLHEYTITGPQRKGSVDLLVKQIKDKSVSIDASNGRFNFSLEVPTALENPIHESQEGPYVYFYLVPSSQNPNRTLIELEHRFTCPKPSVVATNTRFRHDVEIKARSLEHLTKRGRGSA
ncbi:hypothetical protein DdX_16400 [Ditylenchus destructor]|uniref:Uncharacterized protein n=1 Tax=Ditylenchus destructor TaxID=166010 RepID=A0AAD4R047_9BILA|nr:hypothetical protein DdX_16400 [Ditylenchus destructor]